MIQNEKQRKYVTWDKAQKLNNFNYYLEIKIVSSDRLKLMLKRTISSLVLFLFPHQISSSSAKEKGIFCFWIDCTSNFVSGAYYIDHHAPIRSPTQIWAQPRRGLTMGTFVRSSSKMICGLKIAEGVVHHETHRKYSNSHDRKCFWMYSLRVGTMQSEEDDMPI